MSAATKLLAFAALIAVVFGAAAAVGAAVGPIDVGSETPTHDAHVAGGPEAGELQPGDHPRGLAVAQNGYRLTVDQTTVAAGAPSSFGFQIVDDAGTPFTAFDQLHERALHLIVLSRTMVDYLHLHPTMDSRGHWTVDLPALASGSYRVFADFQPTGATNLTLGTDITVPGDVHAVELPAPGATSTVEGYTVTMTGTPAVGDAELGLSVQVDGQVVRTEPYLGAAGHLVAIRSGDLAYLHVHPHPDDTTVETSDATAVTFTGEFPTAGTYRLFFDFSHDGTVRTAAFTVIVATPEDGH